jgi:hypothetical protein
MNYSTSGALALCLLGSLLSACGGGNGTSTQQHFAEEGLAGSYSQAYLDRQGQPHLLKAVLLDSQNLTLVEFDAEDNSHAYAGRYLPEKTSSNIVFGDLAQCQKEGQMLSCVVQGQALTLAIEAPASAPDVSTLSGNYSVMLNGVRTAIELNAQGQFSLSYNNCPFKGELSVEVSHTQIGVRISSVACGYSLARGFIELESLYSNNDSLAIYLPESPISGHWLR